MRSSDELVSVIIPAYNRASFLERAVNSALLQTHPLIEVIIVDDGSTDETAATSIPLGDLDRRIRLVQHDSRRGAQAARNTGIRAAEGRWVAFLDSDDVLFPTSVEIRLAEAEKRQVQVVHSECVVWRPSESEAVPFGVPMLEGQVYVRLLANPGPVFPGILAARSALEQIGLLDESIRSFQEWDTAIRLSRRFSFGFVQDPTFCYDCRHGQTISKDGLRTAQGYEQIVRKHRWEILRHVGKRALIRHYGIAAAHYRNAEAEGDAHRCECIAGFIDRLENAIRAPRRYAGRLKRWSLRMWRGRDEG